MTNQQQTQPSASNQFLTGSLLLLALIITRSGMPGSHFGTDINFPDASWGIFWLCGALTSKRWWPVPLMLACVAVDYFVIAGGVSAYCFTPAYPFLIPAYLSLWGMGRWSQDQLQISPSALLHIALSVMFGATACFAISNIGFYVAAGYFSAMPTALYAQTVIRYWPHYLQTTGLYVAIGLVSYCLVRVIYVARNPDLQRTN